jgi:hypothetical protein
MRAVWAARIFQNSIISLQPVSTVGDEIVEKSQRGTYTLIDWGGTMKLLILLLAFTVQAYADEPVYRADVEKMSDTTWKVSNPHFEWNRKSYKILTTYDGVTAICALAEKPGISTLDTFSYFGPWAAVNVRGEIIGSGEDTSSVIESVICRQQ